MKATTKAKECVGMCYASVAVNNGREQCNTHTHTHGAGKTWKGARARDRGIFTVGTVVFMLRFKQKHETACSYRKGLESASTSTTVSVYCRYQFGLPIEMRASKHGGVCMQ